MEGFNERQARVLQAIVRDHIRTGEPVGSRALAERYRLGVSPATVRGDMAALERLGYLTQPHTSAGRIPTDLGYRFYVDTLPGLPRLAEGHRHAISEAIDDRIADIEELMRKTAQVLSRTTRYAAVALPPVPESAGILRAELVPIGSAALLLVVGENGHVDRRMLDVELSSEVLARLGAKLSEGLGGLTYSAARVRARSMAGEAHEQERAALLEIADTFGRFEADPAGEHVFLGGVGNIAGEEVFEHRDSLRKLFEALDEEAAMLRFLRVLAQEGEQLAVRIGGENPLPAMREASVVVATYEVGGRAVGTIAVIGPTRMQYPAAMSAVDAVSRRLSSVIESLGG